MISHVVDLWNFFIKKQEAYSCVHTVSASNLTFFPFALLVCEKVLEAAASVLLVHKVSLEKLLHFIAAIPREFTDFGGMLIIAVYFW